MNANIGREDTHNPHATALDYKWIPGPAKSIINTLRNNVQAKERLVEGHHLQHCSAQVNNLWVCGEESH